MRYPDAKVKATHTAQLIVMISPELKQRLVDIVYENRTTLRNVVSEACEEYVMRRLGAPSAPRPTVIEP